MSVLDYFDKGNWDLFINPFHSYRSINSIKKIFSTFSVKAISALYQTLHSAKKEMLSRVIKNMVEQKFGHQIRYPRDCDALALHVSTVCKTGLSGSTLKRLFGFTKRKGNEQPRLYTLDIISTYLGHKGWEELAVQLIKGDVNTNFVALDELLPAKLKKGEVIQMGYEPGKEITLQYTGKNQFIVKASNDGKLCATDMIKFQKAVLHYPLLINEVIHAGNNAGQYVAGRISGIIYIRKIRDEKQPAKK